MSENSPKQKTFEEIDMPELVWPNKKTQVKRYDLPFQDVETLTEDRILKQNRLDQWTEEAMDWPENYPKNWKNKLIWGDNKYVMSSLLNQGWAGKIDLIYIDPPFATGADFSVDIDIDNQTTTKKSNVIEEKAYRDTWGEGISSYLQTMYERLVLMKELLSEEGSIYVHLDWRVGHYVKILLDEIFGRKNFRNHITWKRHTMVSGVSSGMEQYSKKTDHIYFYSKSDNYNFDVPYQRVDNEEILNNKFNKVEEETGRRFETQPMILRGSEPKKLNFPSKEIELPQGKRFAWNQETLNKKLEENPNIIYWTRRGNPRYKKYKDEYEGVPCSDLWDDVNAISSNSNESLNFPTQKPIKLLERLIKSSSNEGDIVADFFCGSGTTGTVAEIMGRRWVMSDLSKYAIHTTRKRLLGIHKSSHDYDNPCRPFVIQNMGNYQKQKFIENGHPPIEDYVNFILNLYGAEPIEGYSFLHGKKGRRYIHVGSVDSIVTNEEIVDAIEEMLDGPGGEKITFLAWDYEMEKDKNTKLIEKDYDVDIKLLKIPKEASEVEKANVQGSEVKFLHMNSLDIDKKKEGNKVYLKLKDFIIADSKYLPEEIRDDIDDYLKLVDYWSVDFDYQADTFHNMWQSFRTRQDKELDKKCSHTYDEPGEYKILVKVIDVMGNDTNKLLTVNIE